MKRLIVFLFFILQGAALQAALPTQVVDLGATSTGTITNISVATTAATLAYSTGTYRDGVAASTNATYGQYMHDRIQMEFQNNTSTTVWVGYELNITTFPGPFMGHKMDPGDTWSHAGRVKDFWVRSASATTQSFTTTQEK